MAATTNLADLKQANQSSARKEPVTYAEKAAFLKQKVPTLKVMTLSAGRIIHTALVQMSQTPTLLECSAKSIYQSICNAVSMGLEITGGQGYLVPYKGKCQFIPGWQGLVDLVSRTGRANVWAQAVFEGDEFEWALGDSPFVRHKPMGEDDPTKITHVYAIGRVKGSDWPNIEVWTMDRVRKHLKKYNKVGARHYAYDNMEMYGRKVVLLQVLKYMPKSQEVESAIEASHRAESGIDYTIDGEGLVREVDDEGNAVDPTPVDQQRDDRTVEDPQIGERTQQRETTAAQRPDPLDTTSGEVTQRSASAPVESQANKIAASLRNAKDFDVLDAAADLIREAPSEQRPELQALYRARREELSGGTKPAKQMAMSID